jgi:hypothetical protein
MKNLRILSILLIVLMATAGLAEARNGKGKGKTRQRCQDQTALADLPTEDLSDAEKESLLLMREEEKLARDVYLALGEKFDIPVFSNIPRSEQRHMDQMGVLLEKYELEDPMLAEAGKFSNDEMQKLYNQLVKQGSKSEIDALKVGATIEDLDIYDLEKALAEDINNQDITRVYQNLTKGSRNHMRAFMSQLEARDASYEAQYIAQADLDAIVSSDWERGPADGQKMAGKGRGQGNGKGMGKGMGNGQGQGQGQGRGQGCRQFDDCKPRCNQ